MIARLRRARLILALAMVSAGVICSISLFAQRGGPGGGADMAAVNAPYEGIIAAEGKEDGLFKISKTGLSTKDIKEAADKFLESLSASQRQSATFAVDDSEWRLWDNRHFYQRQGVGFDEMTDSQRAAAFELIGASMSAKGLQKTKDIMKLNGTLAELCNNFDEYGRWLYWMTVMGEPSTTEPWGWQLDGHHAIVNFFVLGDQVVMSPVFMGSEPVRADGGAFQGTVVMQDEQNLGLEFLRSLSSAQQNEAVLMDRKDGNNNLTEAYKDNVRLDYAGLKCDQLSDAQEQKLLALIEEYIGNMRLPHAQVKMSEVKAHLDRTHFAWIGGRTSDSVYYYRVHSPVLLIEFDHQRRVAPQRGASPSRDHIHTVVRTPNGNDYGKDLLRQHYETHPHPH
ncbi:MAG: DUF3500 domain-containing protein [Planctomycetales bacterium]|nr:DUF3500 domain-containing protein [Planctomycetales bacterium]